MSDPSDDFILDLFLEEALSNVQPPDVSQRVLSALAARAGGLPAAGASAPPSLRPIPLTGMSSSLANASGFQGTGREEFRHPEGTRGSGFSGDPVSPHVVVGNGPVSLKRRRIRPALVSFALAASLLLTLGGYWIFADRDPSRMARNAATSPVAASINDQPRDVASAQSAASRDSAADTISTANAPPHVQTADEGRRPLGNNETDLVGTESIGPAEDQIAADSGASPVEPSGSDQLGNPGDELAGVSLSPVLSSSAASDADIVAYINRTIRAHAQDAGLRLSPPATEAEWCRRVHLDLIGRIPTIDELESYLVDNSRNKRARLVDRLLGYDEVRARRRSVNYSELPADQYVETYARFWTVLWTNLLVGRNGGMEPGSPVNRAALEQYLRRSFLANKPYNQMVYELVAARGSNLPGEDDYNGAVNFLLAHLQEKAVTATAKTAQIFLGLQVQCAQCHNHPFNDWKQNRFWELNAFFRQTREERQVQGAELRLARLVEQDFAGESGTSLDEAEIYYEQRNGIMQVAYPAFIDGTLLDRDGRVSQVDRRRELARLIARSDQLSLALVNRLWAHFFGYGFTKPVDDFGPHNAPSHPELLDRLAREFAASGHDLKRLMRWITLSEPYGLSSKFGPKQGNAADDPTQGAAPLFTHFYVRQMLAEQLYDSLLVATGAHLTEGNYTQQQRIKDEWLRQFAIAFGTDENDEATTFDGTITQTLVMMNGELTRRATSGESGSFLHRVMHTTGRKQSEPKGHLNQLYRAALARYPSKSEIQLVGGLLDARDDGSTTVLEDVWWALLNSNEFILNH